MLREAARNNNRIVRFEHPIFLWNVRARTEQSKDLKTREASLFSMPSEVFKQFMNFRLLNDLKEGCRVEKLTPVRVNNYASFQSRCQMPDCGSTADMQRKQRKVGRANRLASI